MIESSKFNLRDLTHTVFFFPVFFAFMYMDTIKLPLSPDLFWKLPMVLILLMIVVRDGKFSFPAFFVFGVLLAVKQLLFYSENVKYYIAAASVAALDLVVPVLTLFFIRHVTYKNLSKALFVLSSCLILATVPYHLGILVNSAAATDNLNLTKYGASGTLFTGPYASIHEASITLSITLFCLLFNYKTSTRAVKIWIVVLFLIGLYGVYLTYVRTALVMVGIGVIIELFLNKKSTRLLSGGVVLVIIASICYIIYLNSSVLQLRLANTNVYDSEVAEGSGRFLFWSTMMKYITSGGPMLFLFGGGRENGRDYMYSAIGQRLFSHNGIIDILVCAGLTGLVLFFFYQRGLFRRLKWSNRKALPSYKLVLTVFLMYYTAIIFQGYQFFWIFILISLTVACLEKEYGFLKFRREI